MHGRAPYDEVLTHGFAVDQHGRKMSKSLGNVVAPQKVVDSLGADILRLWVASTDYRNEMAVSDEILKRVADAYRRIRNTARFLLGNLDGFDPAKHLVPVDECLLLDQWAVQQAHDVQTAVIAAYERYDFPEIVQRVQNFCTNEMGSLYLDITKDRLYTMPTDSHGRRSAQSAMFRILEALVRWLAPITSFTAEEIWPLLPGAARRVGAVRDLVRRPCRAAGFARAAQVVERAAGHAHDRVEGARGHARRRHHRRFAAGRGDPARRRGDSRTRMPRWPTSCASSSSPRELELADMRRQAGRCRARRRPRCLGRRATEQRGQMRALLALSRRCRQPCGRSGALRSLRRERRWRGRNASLVLIARSLRTLSRSPQRIADGWAGSACAIRSSLMHRGKYR